MTCGASSLRCVGSGRQNVVKRPAPVVGMVPGPNWQDVMERDYRPWPDASYVIDTAIQTAALAASELRAKLGS